MATLKDIGNKLVPPEIMVLDESTEITTDVVAKFIKQHREEELPRYQYLLDMYKGLTEIYDQQAKESYKPDNRISVNFPKYIVDTFVGYFNGISIKKSHENEELLNLIQSFDNLNDMDDEDTELAKMACICGRAYQFMFQDEQTRTRTFHGSPINTFIVYTDTVRKVPLFAVRYGVNDKDETVGTVYTQTELTNFSGEGNDLTYGESEINPFGRVPVNEFYLNEERLGLFEPSVAMINAFNKAISEKANDVDYFSDSYLAILGADIDEESLATIRDNRIINLYAPDGAKLPDVRFLDKPDSDAQTENLLDRLQKLIFQTSMVANISDENFGQSSGTALAYKLEAQSNLALAFQRKFTRSMNRRYKLFLSLGTNAPTSLQDEWLNINYTFTRNEPKNIKEEAETANLLMGTTSRETALSVLSKVPDVNAEIKRIDDEMKDLKKEEFPLNSEVVDSNG